jgi:hypothetical protein
MEKKVVAVKKANEQRLIDEVMNPSRDILLIVAKKGWTVAELEPLFFAKCQLDLANGESKAPPVAHAEKVLETISSGGYMYLSDLIFETPTKIMRNCTFCGAMTIADLLWSLRHFDRYADSRDALMKALMPNEPPPRKMIPNRSGHRVKGELQLV